MDSNDPQSRIDFLEQNLRSIREEHDAIVVDLQKELDRLQEENRGIDLHHHFKQIKFNQSRSSLSINQRSSTRTTIIAHIKSIDQWYEYTNH